jgi:hypothetical protein
MVIRQNGIDIKRNYFQYINTLSRKRAGREEEERERERERESASQA